MPVAPTDPLLAVVAPPRVARFRELAGLADNASFEAVWSVLHALRWPERVFVGADVTGSREEALEVAHRALA